MRSDEMSYHVVRSRVIAYQSMILRDVHCIMMLQHVRMILSCHQDLRCNTSFTACILYVDVRDNMFSCVMFMMNISISSNQVHGNFYGTSISAVDHVSRHGKICILEIDIQGAEKVAKTQLKPYYFFISPPNFDELEARLRGRQTEDEHTIKTRLESK